MIKLENLNKHYPSKAGDVVALNNIKLHVQPGEIYGVIGRSGAGKSTLIRCVNLLERPNSGAVIVDQQNLIQLEPKQLREARHNIGMVFQHFNLLNSRTVFNNIALPLELQKIDRASIQKTVTSLLEWVDLADKRDQYPTQLSGGQKQRVAIARALATEPKVLLCDEMTSALDPETTQSILKLIKDINQKMNLSILLITHEMDVIKSICDRVAVIEKGEIIEEGTVVDVFRHPKTEITKNLTQASMKLNLSNTVLSQLKQRAKKTGQIILKITFIGKAATEPLINQLIKKFDMDVNLLQANLESLGKEDVGMMVLSLQGSIENMQAGIAFLKDQDLTVEIINDE